MISIQVWKSGFPDSAVVSHKELPLELFYLHSLPLVHLKKAKDSSVMLEGNLPDRGISQVSSYSNST